LNTTLSKWMSIAITAIVISSLIFVVLFQTISDKANENEEDFKSQETEVIGG
jgi:hypothetical protein